MICINCVVFFIGGRSSITSPRRCAGRTPRQPPLGGFYLMALRLLSPCLSRYFHLLSSAWGPSQRTRHPDRVEVPLGLLQQYGLPAGPVVGRPGEG